MLVQDNPALSESQTLTYEVLTEMDRASAAACIGRVFVDHEPLCQKLNIVEAEMETIADAFCQVAISDESAVIVKDAITNRVVGFCIGHDFLADPFANGGEADPALEPIMVLLDLIYGEYMKIPHEQGQSFLINVGGVDLQYLRDRGIGEAETGNAVAKRLFELTIQIAQGRNYRELVGAATSFFSQNLLKSFGFQEVFRVDYRDFLFNGQPVFKGMPWHHNAQLLVREIT